MSGFRRPTWWAIALTAVAALLFVRLGIWQLHRAAFKEGLLRRYAASVTAPLQDFATVTDPPPIDSFPRVRVSGHYLPSRMYLLDNPHHDERGGIEVFVPFVVTGGGRLLLVDMGFLAAEPDGSTPALPPLSSAPVTLQGSYVPPPPTGLEMGGNALARQSHWPKSSIFLDLGEVRLICISRCIPVCWRCPPTRHRLIGGCVSSIFRTCRHRVTAPTLSSGSRLPLRWWLSCW